MTNWSGMFPAVTIKFSSEEIDIDATQASIDLSVKKGAKGIVVLGLYGESGMTTFAEKDRLIRSAREVVKGRVPLLSGLIECTTRDATHFASHCQRLEIDGLVAFPPNTCETDPDVTIDYFEQIGAVAPSLGIMIQNNPAAYQLDMTAEFLGRIAGIRNIVCIKEKSFDVRRVTDILHRFGDRFLIFCGNDDLVLESVSAGATGWVSGMANAWPAECVELFNLCLARRFEEARSLYHIMIDAFHLDANVKRVQYIKLAEHLACGASENLRRPRKSLTGKERENAEGIIENTIVRLTSRFHHAA